jgi:3-mercaptopyruvate sulfurtransferase SseA
MDTGFGQSCRGFFLLKFLGYPKVKVLHGGYEAWGRRAARFHRSGDADAEDLPDDRHRHRT